MVVCALKGGQPACMLPSDCQTDERSPMVYPCNDPGIIPGSIGKARADGSCECNTNTNTGIGYGPGTSGEGCFALISCLTADNGKVCNSDVDDAGDWTVIEKIDFFEDQFDVFLLREGIALTYENRVKRVTKGLDLLNNLLLSSLIQIAQSVIAAEVAVAGKS